MEGSRQQAEESAAPEQAAEEQAAGGQAEREQSQQDAVAREALLLKEQVAKERAAKEHGTSLQTSPGRVLRLCVSSCPTAIPLLDVGCGVYLALTYYHSYQEDM